MVDPLVPCPVCRDAVSVERRALSENLDPSGGFGDLFRLICSACGHAAEVILHSQYGRRRLRASFLADGIIDAPSAEHDACAACGGAVVPALVLDALPPLLADLLAQSSHEMHGVRLDRSIEQRCLGCSRRTMAD